MAVTENQVTAAGRHLGTATASVTSVLIVLALLPDETTKNVILDLQAMADGLQQAFGAASKLLFVLVPLVVLWMGKLAFTSAGVKSQARALLAQALGGDSKATEAQTALLNATTVMAEAGTGIKIEGKITAPPVVAEAVPSEKVVAKE